MKKFHHFSFLICLLSGFCLSNSSYAQLTQEWQYSNKLTASFFPGLSGDGARIACKDGSGYLFGVLKNNIVDGFRKVSSTGDSVFRSPNVYSSNESGKLSSTTSDGGFLCVGRGIGTKAMMVIKLSANATYQWRANFGGTNDTYETITSAIQTSDGGYIAVGGSNATDGDCVGSHGSGDGFCVKIDANGLTQWKKVLGGSGWERLYSVIEDNNGNFVMAGVSSSGDGDLPNNYGGNDVWVIKLNSSGNIIWSKNYGGDIDDVGNSNSVSNNLNLFATADGSYLVRTASLSSNGDFLGGISNGSDEEDYLLKISSSGNVIWANVTNWTQATSLGGSGVASVRDMYKTIDGFASMGLVIDTTITPKMTKLDANGNLLWHYSFPTNFTSIFLPTTDGGFYFIGGGGVQTKYKDNTIAIEESIGDAHLLKIYPNPSTGLVKIQVAENTGFIAVKVQDMLGKEIINTSMPNGAELVLTDYPAGCYTVTIKSENGKVYTEKVVKN